MTENSFYYQVVHPKSRIFFSRKSVKHGDLRQPTHGCDLHTISGNRFFQNLNFEQNPIESQCLSFNSNLPFSLPFPLTETLSVYTAFTHYK